MRIGFYAGSFDPFTKGHLYIVQQASKLFDKVIVGIGVNPKKARKYAKEQMQDAINKVFKDEGLDNCECINFEGLTADVALEYGTTFLIRGIRNGMDYDYEESLAMVNQEISGLDTFYLRAGEYGAISSSMVNELLSRNKNVEKYLPIQIENLIKSQRKE